MKTQPLGRSVLKSVLVAALCMAAFAARAALTVPLPRCSQGSYERFVNIAWSAVPGALKYTIVRSGNADINSASEINTLTETSYQDYAVKPGTKYYYWILVWENSADYYYLPSRYAMGYAKKPTVPKPTATDGTIAAHTRITWKSVTGASQYLLYYSPTKYIADSYVYDAGTSLGVTHAGTPGKKYYYWVSAVINGYEFRSAADVGWRKKVLTVYTPKAVLIAPTFGLDGMFWWYCALSGDLICPSKASLSVSVKGCASFTKYGALDDYGYCGDITGKKNGKAYITVKHSSLTVKSKAITIYKYPAGVNSASAN